MDKTVKAEQHEVTDTLHFKHGDQKITVEVENTSKRFYWRMQVGDSWSEWTSYYAGVLVHAGYGLTTDYWSHCLPAFVPFKITSCLPA